MNEYPGERTSGARDQKRLALEGLQNAGLTASLPVPHIVVSEFRNSLEQARSKLFDRKTPSGCRQARSAASP
jgi:hypothetical protein